MTHSLCLGSPNTGSVTDLEMEAPAVQHCTAAQCGSEWGEMVGVPWPFALQVFAPGVLACSAGVAAGDKVAVLVRLEHGAR